MIVTQSLRPCVLDCGGCDAAFGHDATPFAAFAFIGHSHPISAFPCASGKFPSSLLQPIQGKSRHFLKNIWDYPVDGSVR